LQCTRPCTHMGPRTAATPCPRDHAAAGAYVISRRYLLLGVGASATAVEAAASNELAWNPRRSGILLVAHQKFPRILQRRGLHCSGAACTCPTPAMRGRRGRSTPRPAESHGVIGCKTRAPNMVRVPSRRAQACRSSPRGARARGCHGLRRGGGRGVRGGCLACNAIHRAPAQPDRARFAGLDAERGWRARHRAPGSCSGRAR
jgi:hypothetical protein